MSANVETLDGWVEAWNHDDFDTWIDALDPEVEWFTLVEVYRGHAGARDAWESLKGVQRPRVRIGEFRDLGDSVLTLGEVVTVGQATRLSFSGEFAQFAQFRNGRIANVRDFASHAEALDAAGLEA